MGIPVYSAIKPSAAEGAISIYAGQGTTKDQAIAFAIMEAFGRYSAEQEGHVMDNLSWGIYDVLIQNSKKNMIGVVTPCIREQISLKIITL